MGALEKLDTVHVSSEAGGDREAFETMVREHRRRVFGLCYRYTGNAADAEDLVQEVFLRAYRALDGFRGDSSLSTWIYRIAVNVCLNWVSSKKRVSGDELPHDVVDGSPSPAEQLSREQTSSAVRDAVRQLPEKQRMTLVLRVYEELTHKEIAEVMGCPVGTAKANFFFALKNLRKQLESESDKLFHGAGT